MLAVYYSILIKFQDIEIKSLTFVLSIVFHIICFFALFIFLEIIQLNFCGINKDANFKIGLRTEVDKYMKSNFIRERDNIKNKKKIKYKGKVYKGENRNYLRDSDGIFIVFDLSLKKFS